MATHVEHGASGKVTTGTSMSPLQRWRSISYERWMILLTLVFVIVLGGGVILVIQGVANDVRYNRILIQGVQDEVQESQKLIQEEHIYIIHRNQELINQNNQLKKENRILVRKLLKR